MINALPPSEGRQNISLFVKTVWRDDQSNMLADSFLGGVSKNSLCSFVPIGDSTVEGFSDNGILRGLDYGSETGERLLGALALSLMSRFDSRTEMIFPRASRSATHRVDTVILEPFAQVCRSSPAQ